MLWHNNLSNYSPLIHHLVAVQNKYSVNEIESMMPFERDIYIGLGRMHAEEQNRAES
jgi:hypothetical protein